MSEFRKMATNAFMFSPAGFQHYISFKKAAHAFASPKTSWKEEGQWRNNRIKQLLSNGRRQKHFLKSSFDFTLRRAALPLFVMATADPDPVKEAIGKAEKLFELFLEEGEKSVFPKGTVAEGGKKVRKVIDTARKVIDLLENGRKSEGGSEGDGDVIDAEFLELPEMYLPSGETDSNKELQEKKKTSSLDDSEIEKPLADFKGDKAEVDTAEVADLGRGRWGRIGVVIVDHGSRRQESNSLLTAFVNLFRQKYPDYAFVSDAHMELARPSIADAFEMCVNRGCQTVVISPYFLSPGRHWHEDIPRLASEAASRYDGVKYIVTAPLGMHDLLAQLLEIRINDCLDHSAGLRGECDMCRYSSDVCAVSQTAGAPLP